MSSLTQKQMIQEIAKSTGVPVQTCSEVISQLSALIAEQLNFNSECALPGVGKLLVKCRSERAGRNPQTGESIIIPARNIVSIRPGKHIKEIVNRRTGN